LNSRLNRFKPPHSGWAHALPSRLPCLGAPCHFRSCPPASGLVSRPSLPNRRAGPLPNSRCMAPLPYRPLSSAPSCRTALKGTEPNCHRSPPSTPPPLQLGAHPPLSPSGDLWSKSAVGPLFPTPKSKLPPPLHPPHSELPPLAIVLLRHQSLLTPHPTLML
jgi:hypothetical protein